MKIPTVPTLPKIPPATGQPTSKQQEKKFLTVRTLKHLLEREGYEPSRTTLYRMIDDGRVNSHRFGSKILVPLSELEALIRRSAQGLRY